MKLILLLTFILISYHVKEGLTGCGSSSLNTETTRIIEYINNGNYADRWSWVSGLLTMENLLDFCRNNINRFGKSDENNSWYAEIVTLKVYNGNESSNTVIHGIKCYGVLNDSQNRGYTDFLVNVNGRWRHLSNSQVTEVSGVENQPA